MHPGLQGLCGCRVCACASHLVISLPCWAMLIRSMALWKARRSRKPVCMQAWATGLVNETSRALSAVSSCVVMLCCLCSCCTAWPTNVTSTGAVLLDPKAGSSQCAPALWLFARSHTRARTSLGSPERWKKLQTAQRSAAHSMRGSIASAGEAWRRGCYGQAC